MPKLTAYLLVSSALVLWGLSAVFTKNMLDAGLGALEIAFWRLGLSSVLFIVHAVAQRDFKLKAKRDLGQFAAFAAFTISLNYVSFNYAVDYGGVSLVNVLLATVPVFVAIPAWLFFRERLSLRLLSLLGLSMGGLLLASWGGDKGIDISLPSLGFSLLAIVTYAAFTLASKPLLDRYTPVAMNAFVMPLAALALLPFVSFTATKNLFQEWGDLALLTLLPSYLAFLLYHAGLKQLEVSRAALLTNLDPATGLVLAALLFDERFSALGVVGVMLVLGVSALATLPERSKRPVLGNVCEPALTMLLEGSRAEAEK